ncbi:zinc ABC transporter substrate-binding protein [Paenibacillus sp. TRM 82003]|nr:zinc ABC transporter substrate-binding protein [Paenibacillus sp. TRM 82003]
MKRFWKTTGAAALALAVFAGCSSQGGAGANAGAGASEGVSDEGKVSVVTSFFPLYDFARKIGGEHANVVNMVPTGVEPHDWTPKSKDMALLSKAQAFIYQGAGFEGWTEDVLGGVNNEALVVVEASRGIELMKADGHEEEAHADEHAHEEEAHADEHAHEEEAPADEHAHEEEAHADEHAHEEEAHADEHAHEGAAAADEHGHAEEGQAEEVHKEEAHASDDGHNHGAYDPHTWLSPRSAITMASNVLEGLKAADPAHAAEFEANFEALKAELEALDQTFADRISALPNKEMVVSHQAFGYLARDYGLVQMPIMGISPEAEPTAQDLKKISEFVKEHGVKYIFTEELVSDQLAKTLANDLGVSTLPLHPLEGLTDEEEAAGETYVTIMTRNLEHLEKALKDQ